MSATFRYFATCSGETVKLSNVYFSGRTRKEFTGTCPTCGQLHISDRVIRYKSEPSKHKCSDKCRSAKGHLCECECGGKNHGSQA